MSQDQQIQIVYSVILLVAIISGFIFNKRLSKLDFIRPALVWIGIFFMIILAYSFKDRIASELHPSKPITEGQMIVINRSNDEHFYIDLLVNNKNIRFLVDTGASSIALSQRDAKKIGIDIDSLEFNQKVSTANGVTFKAQTTVSTIKLNDIVFNNIPVTVSSGGLDVSLLGMSFLENFDYYTFDGDKLYLKY
jgi:aspartyl protease family protein